MKALPSSTVRAYAAPRFATDATAYFFDLSPIIGCVGLVSNPERLRLICERHVRSIVGSDLVLFVQNGFYLVVTSSSGPAAHGLANYVNTSLLMLLFGTESLSPQQRLTMYRAVDVDEVPAHSPTLGGAGINPDPRWGESRDVAIREEDVLSVLARDGIHVEQGVELTFFPVHDLRRRAVSSLFCVPTFAGAVFGHQAFHHLNQAELPYIDRAILTHSLAFARRLAEAGIVIGVGAPVSFETLAWSKSRQIYQWALRAANVAGMPQIILKVEDIPPGTPADRISQVVSGLRPFCRHIFVHLPNDHVELGMTGRMGASGLVLSLQRRAALPEVLADCRYLSRMAMAQSAMSCIDHVESDEALNVVRSAGIRFAVGNVFGAETVSGTAPVETVRSLLANIEHAIADRLAATVTH